MPRPGASRRTTMALAFVAGAGAGVPVAGSWRRSTRRRLVVFVGNPGWSTSVRLRRRWRRGLVPLAPGEVYYPTYVADVGYRRRINVATVTNVTYITNVTRVTTVTYRNRGVSGAVTAVPERVFVGASGLPISSEARSGRPPAGPRGRHGTDAGADEGESRRRRAGAAGAAAPAETDARPVAATHAPPQAAVPFSTQERAIAANGGRPLAPAQVRSLPTSTPTASRAGRSGRPTRRPPVAAGWCGRPHRPPGGRRHRPAPRSGRLRRGLRNERRPSPPQRAADLPADQRPRPGATDRPRNRGQQSAPACLHAPAVLSSRACDGGNASPAGVRPAQNRGKRRRRCRAARRRGPRSRRALQSGPSQGPRRLAAATTRRRFPLFGLGELLPVTRSTVARSLDRTAGAWRAGGRGTAASVAGRSVAPGPWALVGPAGRPRRCGATGAARSGARGGAGRSGARAGAGARPADGAADRTSPRHRGPARWPTGTSCSAGRSESGRKRPDLRRRQWPARRSRRLAVPASRTARPLWRCVRGGNRSRHQSLRGSGARRSGRRRRDSPSSAPASVPCRPRGLLESPGASLTTDRETGWAPTKTRSGTAVTAPILRGYGR